MTSIAGPITPGDHGVIARCGHCLVEQRIFLPYDRVAAEVFRQLLCGRGAVYVSEPADDPTSVIGKSACCGAAIESNLFGYPEPS